MIASAVTTPASMSARSWPTVFSTTSYLTALLPFLACGTGACATAVAAIRRKLVQSPVEVRLPGGTLTIAWAPGETIRMSGPATHVFTGELPS